MATDTQAMAEEVMGVIENEGAGLSLPDYIDYLKDVQREVAIGITAARSVLLRSGETPLAFDGADSHLDPFYGNS